MASITLRNLDEDLMARLRAVAERHGRSMEDEVRVILAQALSRNDEGNGLGSRNHARFASIGAADINLPTRQTKARAADLDG